MRTSVSFALTAWLATAAPALLAQAPASTGDISPVLHAAQAWLARLVTGVGDGTRIAYEQDGDTVRFRVDAATLGQPGRPIAEGILEFDRDGLRRFRILDGVAYDRHREFKQRAARLGLGASEMQVLLGQDQPRPGAAARRHPATGLPMDLMRGADGDAAEVEAVRFDGRGPATAEAPDGEPVAAWRLRVRVGRGAAQRRYDATIEPFGGAVIALERR